MINRIRSIFFKKKIHLIIKVYIEGPTKCRIILDLSPYDILNIVIRLKAPFFKLKVLTWINLMYIVRFDLNPVKYLNLCNYNILIINILKGFKK